MRKGLLILAIVILVAAAGGAGWLAWRTPPEASAPPEPRPPARESFHVSKPLDVVVERLAPDDTAPVPIPWLTREIRHLLTFGKMRLLPASAARDDAFTLRIAIVGEESAAQASIALLAPDGHLERQVELSLDLTTRLDAVRTLADELPAFLNAVRATGWASALGTEDSAAYETFVSAAVDLLGPSGRGFTLPPAVAGQRTRTLERLEVLTRQHSGFARGWGLLALAYLSLTGDDHDALTQMAEAAAKHALSLDPELPDARSAAGLVALRRGQWAHAQDQLSAALSADANAVAALEGLACLWADAGRSTAALSMAQRAVALQPRNAGARECLTYAQLALRPQDRRALATSEDDQPPEVARVTALTAILSGDVVTAQHALNRTVPRGGSRAWVDAMVRAANSRRYTAAALQAITHAASEGHIDASLEVLCGAALRQADFVFNRMLRLHKQGQDVPLRMLWLEETEFLRRHPRFEEIVNAAELTTFWQDHGVPDACTLDPTLYGCHLKRRP